MSFYTDEQISMILSTFEGGQYWDKMDDELELDAHLAWEFNVIGLSAALEYAPFTADDMLRDLEKRGLA